MTGPAGCIQLTASGRAVAPLDPWPEDICALDIAFHLGAICRWGGSTVRHYSVAEHSVMLARHFLQHDSERLAAWALLHDAAEAYLGDIVRPLKGRLHEFRIAEAALERVIWDKYGLAGELPPEVVAADTAILGDEREQAFGPGSVHARHKREGETGLGIRLALWPREVATINFMTLFVRLFGART